MKKTIRKLSISSETIRSLATASLGHAHGGILKSARCQDTDYDCDPPGTFMDCPSLNLCLNSLAACPVSAVCQTP